MPNVRPREEAVWSHAGGSLVAFVQRFYGAIENNPNLAKAVPNGPEYSALQTIEGIEKGGVFNAQELRALGSGNGRKLLGLHT